MDTDTDTVRDMDRDRDTDMDKGRHSKWNTDDFNNVTHTKTRTTVQK
jgi:hypothetical protein